MSNQLEKLIFLAANNVRWARYEDLEYPLPLLGTVQLNNSALAIATIKILQQQGWLIPELAIQTGINKTRWQGRFTVDYLEKPTSIDRWGA